MAVADAVAAAEAVAAVAVAAAEAPNAKPGQMTGLCWKRNHFFDHRNAAKE